MLTKESTLAYSGKRSRRSITAVAESSLGYILREKAARFSQRQKRAAGDRYIDREDKK